MSDLLITLEDGVELSFAQATELVRLIEHAEEGTTHWHLNECRCCVALHGPDYAYVIDRDGDSTFFAERGCECG